jgi:serine/threonine protein kinase
LLLNDLAAHRESYYNANVLHRDISAGNILIYEGGGLLIDWDMSKDLDLKSDEKSILRTVGYIFVPYTPVLTTVSILSGHLGFPISSSFAVARGKSG